MSTSPEQSVRLAPLEAKHLDAIFEWLEDEDLRDHIGTVRPPTRASHEAWFKAQSSDGARIAFVVERADTGAPVGLVGLSGIDLVYRRAEVWIYLGTEAARGHGAGRTAFAALASYAFGTLGLHRLEANVFGFNSRAQKFFERCGMTPEGCRREAVFKRGRFWDVHVFGLLAEESADG